MTTPAIAPPLRPFELGSLFVSAEFVDPEAAEGDDADPETDADPDVDDDAGADVVVELWIVVLDETWPRI